MGWEDRPYYRDQNSSPTNPVLRLLTGSLPLFTVFGIRVRIHASLIIIIVLTLLFAETSGGLGAKSAATSMAILFISVLLHEFGHCFGARAVGGSADDILMWPLGGLAMTSPPHRPWASFLTTAAGPAVNLFICVTAAVVIYFFNGSERSIPWFPLRSGIRSYIPHDNLTFYVWWIFLVNYALLTFNLLLIFFPFDGGRMIQELLWVKIGYYRSMLFATVFGMVGAVVVAAIGLIYIQFMLIWIAAFGFYACFRQRQQLLAMGPEEYADETDYSAAYEQPTTSRRRRLSRRALLKARRAVQEARLEQERIDQILAKVSAHGIASLTWAERRALRKATEQRRKRDLELSK